MVTRNEERYRINEHQFMLAEKKNCSRIVWLTRHRDGCQWTESESPLRNAFLIQGHFRSRMSTRVVFPDLPQKRTTWVEYCLLKIGKFCHTLIRRGWSKFEIFQQPTATVRTINEYSHDFLFCGTIISVWKKSFQNKNKTYFKNDVSDL